MWKSWQPSIEVLINKISLILSTLVLSEQESRTLMLLQTFMAFFNLIFRALLTLENWLKRNLKLQGIWDVKSLEMES